MTVYQYVDRLLRDGFGTVSFRHMPERDVCEAEVDAVTFERNIRGGAVMRLVTAAGTADLEILPARRIRGRSGAAGIARELEAAGMRPAGDVKRALLVLWAREALDWQSF